MLGAAARRRTERGYSAAHFAFRLWLWRALERSRPSLRAQFKGFYHFFYFLLSTLVIFKLNSSERSVIEDPQHIELENVRRAAE
jgi:hypothetical protein